jgi:hypothetical protein
VLVVDLATRAHAVHASIRPAALLPVEADALRRIELESVACCRRRSSC